MSDANMPPVEDKGMGCFAKGCLSFTGFFLFLLIAFVGGGLWAVNHLRSTYSSPEPVAMPEISSTPEPEIAATPTAPPVAQLPTSETPVQLPAEPAPAPEISYEPVQKRWKDFEKAAHRHQKARIELTAGDINTLINDAHNLRGKAFVTIAGNVGQVQVSIPLKDLPMMKGRYLNGSATVQSSPDGDPAKAQISNINFGSEAVPDNFIDRRVFGWSSLRDYVSEWLNDRDVGTFRIEDGKVIGETRG